MLRSAPGIVDAVEPVGAESFVHATAAGRPLIVRVAGRGSVVPGAPLDITVTPAGLHWFGTDGRRVGPS